MQKRKVNSTTDLITIQSQLEVRLNKSLNMIIELNRLLAKQSKLEKSMANLASQLTKSRRAAVQVLEEELGEFGFSYGDRLN